MSKIIIVVKTRAGSVDDSGLERSELRTEMERVTWPGGSLREDGCLRYSVTKLNSTENHISKLTARQLDWPLSIDSIDS